MLKAVILAVSVLALPAHAQEKSFTLKVPDSLNESGFLRHLLPRFSLKTGIRITVTGDTSDASFGANGVPVFRQGEKVWHFSKTDGPFTQAFEDWLLSDVGKRTIEAFAPDGEPLFSADVSAREVTQVASVEGDTALGEKVSLAACGRCHVVSEANRMKAIGSTPSFKLMRTFPDWRDRFQAFYVLKPHAAFTQVEGVTAPFEAHLPPPIAPVEVTLEEIEAISAYVASLIPADLGAPIQAQ